MRTLLSRYSGACRSGDTSGRNRKALPLAALVVAIAMIMSTVLFGATRANAAELSENVITSAELVEDHSAVSNGGAQDGLRSAE